MKGRITPLVNVSGITALQRTSDIVNILITLFTVKYITVQSFGERDLLLIVSMLLIFYIVSDVTNFYRSWQGCSQLQEIQKTVSIWTISFVIFFALSCWVPGHDIHQRIWGIWFLVVLITMPVSRLLLRIFIRTLVRLQGRERYIAIAGSSETACELARSLRAASWCGLKLRGHYGEARTQGTINLVGSLDDLLTEVKSGRLGLVYIAMTAEERESASALLLRLADTTCSLAFVPEQISSPLLQPSGELVNGIPVIPFVESPHRGINRILKRLLDIIVTSVVLLLISPVLLVIAVAVRVTSDGPVIFRQTRYGLDGAKISVWKFRTMTVMENGSEVQQTTISDARVTPVGSFLRRTSLDELPQFINVLTGTMSVVGPRPHAVAHNEYYRRLIEGYMFRHKVKPGITGWAQINGWRGETDTLEKMEMRVACDLEYILRWSLWFDIKIILITVFKGFTGKNVY